MKKDFLTPRERLLNSIYGKEVDRIAFAPFLAYYWETQPLEIQEKGMKWFCDEIGADFMHRGSHLLVNVERKNCEINDLIQGKHRVVEYITKVGTIKEAYTYVAESKTWFLSEHFVKNVEDLKVLTYVLENMRLSPNFNSYENDKKHIGDSGLYIPVISPELKSGFQSLTERYFGVEQLNYALCDYPDQVNCCLDIFKRNSDLSVDISLNSSAEAFIFWEDSSTTLTSPSQFAQYVLPEVNSWASKIHSAGKKLIHHACGLLKDLLPLMANSDVDFIESLSPPPTGNISIKDAFSILPLNKGIIGGIEPTRLLKGEGIREDTLELLRVAKNRRYILANSDSCPPNVSIETLKLISKIAKEQAYEL